MRWLIVLLVLVLVVGCENDGKVLDEKSVDKEKAIDENTECATDADCVAGGCSGTVCRSRNAEQVFTTCEWREEYRCYKLIECSCIDGRCQWEKTNEFDDCAEEARSGGLGSFK